MKTISLFLICLIFNSNLFSQGIKLLYKFNTGWDNPLSWEQLDAPTGQTPIQRVPTALDDVIISKSLSGIEVVVFETTLAQNAEFNIGGNSGTGTTHCRSMHISNTDISFTINNVFDYAANVNIYTQNGGFVIIDSASNLQAGLFQLKGGNTAVTDLQVINSNFGNLVSYANSSEIRWDAAAKLKFIKSRFGGFYFGGNTGGNIYADSCVFETANFILGDNSTNTILNSKITNNENNVFLKFQIGHNALLTSLKDTVETYSVLEFTTSGVEFNGDVRSYGYGPGNVKFLQKDIANPLPNIINGNFNGGEFESLSISGDLKISGDFYGFADINYNQPPAVVVNGIYAFNAGGISNYANTLAINNCVNNFCNFKLEFYGNSNSNIIWNGGFTIDTLVINKSNCAQVTFDSAIYVSGATNILNGQLTLNPNPNHPYKFVCAGDVDIAVGGGLFQRRDQNGNVANIAYGGSFTDHNLTADSTCQGYSNPYGGRRTFFYGLVPISLLEFTGKYFNNAVSLNWKTENEINFKYFVIEKSTDLINFTAIGNIMASGAVQVQKNYQQTDNKNLKAINYYRLKMVDNDERFTYSKTISIAAPSPNVISIFPNPVKDILNIQLPGNLKETQITITSATGKIIKRWQTNAGLLSTALNTAGMAAGVYTITFKAGKIRTSLMFVKY